jgi:hypothetical protein
MAGKIFINYRRDDSIGMAGRLHDRLAQEFGRDNLFIDVDHIPFGVDFVAHLNNQVAACGAMLVIIGPNWLTAKDEAGERRLDQPDDFVSIEIAAALARDIRVIPVLVDGARMPRASELPDALKPLTRRQAAEVRHAHFGRDVQTLVTRMREVFGDKAPVADECVALGAKARETGRWRVRAAVGVAAMAVLLLVGLGGYTFVRNFAERGVQQAQLKWEEERRAIEAEANRKVEEAERERQAKAAAEAEQKRKADEVEQQRLAAVKAEQDRQARVAAEAEAKRKADEAERQRQANIRAEQERQARAAAEEAKRRADEAERQRLAAVQAEQERQARYAAEAEARRKSEEAEQRRLAALKAEQERESRQPGAPAFARNAVLLGYFGDWGAYWATPGGKKICFALSKPTSTASEPSGRNRDPSYAFISTRPSDKVKNEVSVIVGYQQKAGHDASASVGSVQYAMYAQNEGAWVKNAAQEAQMVETMRTGSNLVVKSESARGMKTADTYSLRGIAQALDKIAEECR